MEVHRELVNAYYGSRKNEFDAEHYFFRWYRPLSFFPSALLIRMGASANAVTGFGAVCLLTAFALLAAGQLLAGALLYLFAYVVDFMDGNIARYAARPTAFGKMIDGLVDSLTFLLFVALGYGNVVAAQNLLAPAAEITLGVVAGFVFLLRSYFYLRVSLVLAPPKPPGPATVPPSKPQRSRLLQFGKRTYFGIISGMPVLLVLAAALNAVTIYLVVYFLLFSFATLFEVVYGLRRVWLSDLPPAAG